MEAGSRLLLLAACLLAIPTAALATPPTLEEDVARIDLCGPETVPRAGWAGLVGRVTLAEQPVEEGSVAIHVDGSYLGQATLFPGGWFGLPLQLTEVGNHTVTATFPPSAQPGTAPSATATIMAIKAPPQEGLLAEVLCYLVYRPVPSTVEVWALAGGRVAPPLDPGSESTVVGGLQLTAPDQCWYDVWCDQTIYEAVDGFGAPANHIYGVWGTPIGPFTFKDLVVPLEPYCSPWLRAQFWALYDDGETVHTVDQESWPTVCG